MVLDPLLVACISDQFTKLRSLMLSQIHFPQAKCEHHLWMGSKLRVECADAKGDDGDGMTAWKRHTAKAEELAEYAKESRSVKSNPWTHSRSEGTA